MPRWYWAAYCLWTGCTRAGWGAGSRSVWLWRVVLPLTTPASYGLVLLALSVASVGTVAIGRTLNVVLGALLGAVVLHERLTPTRIAGLATVVAGVLPVSTVAFKGA